MSPRTAAGPVLYFGLALLLTLNLGSTPNGIRTRATAVKVFLNAPTLRVSAYEGGVLVARRTGRVACCDLRASRPTHLLARRGRCRTGARSGQG